MKAKLHCTLLFPLLLFLILSAGCDRSSGTLSDYTITEAAKIVSDYNGEKFPMTKAEYLSGNISIRTADDGDIIIFLNWDKKNPDKARFYVLQRDAKDGDSKISVDYEDAQLLFFENNVIVNPVKQKDVFLFVLRGHADEKHLTRFDFTEAFTGYGLLIYNSVYLDLIPEVPDGDFNSIFAMMSQG